MFLQLPTDSEWRDILHRLSDISTILIIVVCRLFVPSVFWIIPLRTQRTFHRVKSSFRRSKSAGSLVSSDLSFQWKTASVQLPLPVKQLWLQISVGSLTGYIKKLLNFQEIFAKCRPRTRKNLLDFGVDLHSCLGMLFLLSLLQLGRTVSLYCCSLGASTLLPVILVMALISILRTSYPLWLCRSAWVGRLSPFLFVRVFVCLSAA